MSRVSKGTLTARMRLDHFLPRADIIGIGRADKASGLRRLPWVSTSRPARLSNDGSPLSRMNWCRLLRSELTSAWPSTRPFWNVSRVLGAAQPHPMSPAFWPRRWNSKRLDCVSTGSGEPARRGVWRGWMLGCFWCEADCGGLCDVVYTRSWSSSSL